MEPFDKLVSRALSEAGVSEERALDHRSLRRLAQDMLDEYRALAGAPFPEDAYTQLTQAVAAVFRSWDAPKAATYRRLNGIEDSSGLAVTVQTMVFGNGGGASGAGVGFTRNPATGERELYVDFQFNAQGEDVVAGRRALTDHERLCQRLPAVWEQLEQAAHRLETLFGDAQDFEFTLQDNQLHLLQTRDAKRTPWAAVRMAVDLVAEGVTTPQNALERLHGVDLAAVSRTRFAGDTTRTTGLRHRREPQRGIRRHRTRCGGSRSARRRRCTSGVGPRGDHDRRYRRHGESHRGLDGFGRSHVACGGGRAPARARSASSAAQHYRSICNGGSAASASGRLLRATSSPWMATRERSIRDAWRS